MSAERFAAAALAAARVATGLIGWRPAEFWAATPAELAAALQGAAGEGASAEAALDGGAMARLMEEHPDGR